MRIQKLYFFLFLAIAPLGHGQEKNVFSVNPEFLIGLTGKSNTNFPESKLQKQAFINLTWHHSAQNKEWTAFVKNAKTGISIGYTDLGNSNQLGAIYTLQPFLAFTPFTSNNLYSYFGLGTSYHTKKHDPVDNPFNKAVSTHFTWSFKMFFYYNILHTKKITYQIGTGVMHNSNGHTRLPNNGYNSFLISLGAALKTRILTTTPTPLTIQPRKSGANYYTLRTGYGLNVLTKAFNDKEGVYTLGGEVGKIIHNTFKVGIGAYVRFYEAYYAYIANNESLVQEGRDFPELRSNPFLKSGNLGVTAHGEVLMNHFGINLQVGINLYKPAYKLDWRLNKRYGEAPKNIAQSNAEDDLGNLDDWYYLLKRSISTRLGVKYYAVSQQKKPTHNLYMGAFLNANLGQADFSEIAVGYVKTFHTKNP